MHANDDSLGVRSASVSGSFRREDHLKSARLPDRLSSSSHITILCSKSRKCPEVIVVPVDKIARRWRRVTRRARQRSALGNKPTQARMLCSISRSTEVLFATKGKFHRKKSAT